MAILHIATAPAELTLFAGTYSTLAAFYDDTRTRGSFEHGELEISNLAFPASGGTDMWLHFEYAQVRNTANPQFWTDTLFELRDSSNRRVMRASMVPTAQLLIEVEDGAGGTATAIQSTPSDGLRFTIDIRVDISGGNVNLEVYYNSALQGTATVPNAGAATNPDRINFGQFDNDNGSGTEGRVYFAEMIIADEDTRGFRLRELTPQSFGVFQQWDGTVASIVDTSLATGVSTDVANEQVSFGLDNLDNVDPGDIINRVVAQSYAQRGPSGLTSLEHFFRYPDTTVFNGPTIALATLGAWYVDEYALNPKTAASWVPADLAGIQLGLEAIT